MSNNKKPLWGNRGQHHDMSLFGKRKNVTRVVQPPIPVRQPIQFSEQKNEDKEVVELIVGNSIDYEESKLKAEEEARIKAEEEARIKAEEEWQQNNLTPEEIEANKRYEEEEEETARLLALEEEQETYPTIEEGYEEQSVSPGENLLSSNLDLNP